MKLPALAFVFTMGFISLLFLLVYDLVGRSQAVGVYVCSQVR